VARIREFARPPLIQIKEASSSVCKVAFTSTANVPETVSIPLSSVIAVLGLLALFTPPAQADCDVPTANWQPRSAVQALAERNNWRIDKLKIDDGCYEVRGQDENGYRFKAKLDPATLEVVNMKRDRQSRDRERAGRLKSGEEK
jgi:hypothetical protein